MSSKQLLAELGSDRRFMGTCPSCGEEFRLIDALLFSIKEQPTEDALAAIELARLQIRNRKVELQKARKRMTARAQLTSHSVNLGKIVEKIVPSFSSFTYHPGDCRALFEPIDYLIFSGLAKSGKVDHVSFIDVKSGSARLSNAQKNIKRVVDSKRVNFIVTSQKTGPKGCRPTGFCVRISHHG